MTNVSNPDYVEVHSAVEDCITNSCQILFFVLTVYRYMELENR